MSLWKDLLGTTKSFFRIGLAGPRLKASGSNLLIRNPGDTADASITVSTANISGDNFVINSDAAGSGADWTLTIARPTTGMTAAWTLTLPTTPGSAGQVLQTDGAGVCSWVSAASTAACDTVDTTSLAFGSSSPVTMFTKPANAVIDKIQVIIDTAFDGTPTASVGISGTTSKYLSTGDIDLTAAAGTVFEVSPGVAAVGGTEALILTYAAGGATVGAARVLVYYSVPS